MRNILLSTQFGKAIVAVLLIMLFILPVSASEHLNSTVSLLSPSTVLSSTVYVNWNNTHGPWDGTLQHPYQRIQDGIDNAVSNDEVFVFHGTYYENIVIYQFNINVHGERCNDTIIDGHGFGTCVRFTDDFSTISNFTIQHSGAQGNDSAVALDANHCIVLKNIIRLNFYGVYAINDDNKIYDNNFLNNTIPAYSVAANVWNDGATGGNFWEGLARVDADENGIIDTPYDIPGGADQDLLPLLHQYGSIMNLDTGKVFLTINAAIEHYSTTDGNVISVAMDTYWEHVVICKELTIDGQNRTQTILDGHQNDTVVRILAANVILQGFTVQNSGSLETDYGVSVENQRTSLVDLLVQDNHHGIIFRMNGDDGLVYRCTVRDNAWNGIYISPGCYGNLIKSTILQGNGFCGLMIYETSYNTVYYNSFIDNHMQAFDSGFNIWDNGYPLGGNYWSDYTGVDANHDGIGDTPYAITGGVGQDRYPLLHVYYGNDTTPPYIQIVSPTSGLYIRNHRFFGRFLPNQILIYGKITIQVNVSDAQSGVREVRFYLDQNSIPEAVVTLAPYTWTWQKPSLLKHSHVVTVVTFDYAGNYNQTAFTVRRWL